MAITQKASSTTHRGVFRFLDLPAELQLHIIEYAVTEPGPIKFTGSRVAVALPAITRVSRGIRVDALPAYYKRNTFFSAVCSYNGFQHWKRWIQAIGKHNRKHIRTLTARGVCCARDGNEEREALMRQTLKKVLAGMGAQIVRAGSFEFKVTFAWPREGLRRR